VEGVEVETLALLVDGGVEPSNTNMERTAANRTLMCKNFFFIASTFSLI
jgi:hypothetical protein